MLNILINAYAVAPNWGSEPGMAWNWIINIAKYCKCYVITEGEWQKEIEEAVKQLPQKDNIIFYYNPVSEKVRKMCWNQGDWRFYYYYRQWQKKTLKIAKDICKEHKIDVIHQLNMIGFREPGLLWKIKEIPYVWGPIGGMELMPTAFLKGETIKIKFIVYIKNLLNKLQRRFQPNVIKAFKHAGALTAATKGVYDFIKEYHNKDIVLLNETGCYEKEMPIKQNNKEIFDIVWVGKFDYRKQLGLTLEIIAKIKNSKKIKLHIIGSGNKEEEKKYRIEAERLGLTDTIIWHGKIPNTEVQKIMRESDLFLFTSIMEGTPHVVLESIQNALPVICFDACGQSGIINSDIGIKIKLTNKENAIIEFSEAITSLYNNREILYKMSINCQQRQKEISWEEKAKTMIELYNKAIHNHII